MDEETAKDKTRAPAADITRNAFDAAGKWLISYKTEGLYEIFGIDYDPNSVILSAELPVITARIKAADFVRLTPDSGKPISGPCGPEAGAGGRPEARAPQPERKHDLHLQHFEFDSDGKDGNIWRYMTYSAEIARRYNELFRKTDIDAKPADIVTYVVYAPSVTGSPADGYGARDSSLQFNVRQIFLGRLIEPNAMIESCREKLRNLSGASKEDASVSEKEFVSLVLIPFFFNNRPKGELEDYLSLVLELSGKIDDASLAALVLTASANQIDLSPFAEEFHRMFNLEIGDLVTAGAYSAALKGKLKAERNATEERTARLEAERTAAEAKKTAAEAKKTAAEAKKNAAEERQNAAEAKKNAAEEKKTATEAKKNAAEAKKNAAEERTARLKAERRIHELEKALALSTRGAADPGGEPDK
ncbi:MAG: hypothetical protein LBW85_11360 [Deltaproteobacteria bacterium]|nr:hypothetical protein [Deltaproteobacteria bacterium]